MSALAQLRDLNRELIEGAEGLSADGFTRVLALARRHQLTDGIGDLAATLTQSARVATRVHRLSPGGSRLGADCRDAVQAVTPALRRVHRRVADSRRIAAVAAAVAVRGG